MRELQEKFFKDIELIYNEIDARDTKLNSYFALSKNREYPEASALVDAFLEHIGIARDKESTLASLTYIVNLREDALTQLMKKRGFTQSQIDSKLELAYLFNAKFYMERFESLLNFIESNQLLNPFYRAILSGVHTVGETITKWQNHWRKHIIQSINRDLFNLFGGDESKIFQMLHQEKLLDCKNGQIADRCYSVLVPNKDGYRRLAYADAFANEVIETSSKLELLIETLHSLEDPIFRQKDAWIAYFLAIKTALTHTNVDNLVALWADVDRAWMQITTPIQIGHPLEYYEDKYRKAVALEWDVRIVNPKMQKESTTKESIKKMAYHLAKEFGDAALETITKNLLQIDNTQLYISRPMFYYGAELNGLFSAQVVPNDEEVSSELGKKIFAYVDFVRESKKAKPIMQLAINTFGIDFIQKQQELLQNNPKLWNKIYDITTIGHEFGHILWIDSDTEVAMNRNGQFKNIEEFKATTGGIMAFFENEEPALKEAFINDIVSRAVSLMAWREVDEVLPYYCEGLIHLELLYESKIIAFNNGMVEIDYSKYSNFKVIYTQAYKELAKNYLERVDAGEFLNNFTQKEEKSYLPKTDVVREFVENYYNAYKEIGNQVAKEFL